VNLVLLVYKTILFAAFCNRVTYLESEKELQVSKAL